MDISLPSTKLLAAAITLALVGGCATTPPDEWVCDAEGPCYRVAQAPYRPGYAYPAYGFFGFGYWSRPYYYGYSPAPSRSTSPSAPADASRGITQPRPTRSTTPGRVQPFSKKKP